MLHGHPQCEECINLKALCVIQSLSYDSGFSLSSITVAACLCIRVIFCLGNVLWKQKWRRQHILFDALWCHKLLPAYRCQKFTRESIRRLLANPSQAMENDGAHFFIKTQPKAIRFVGDYCRICIKDRELCADSRRKSYKNNLSKEYTYHELEIVCTHLTSAYHAWYYLSRCMTCCSLRTCINRVVVSIG